MTLLGTEVGAGLDPHLHRPAISAHRLLSDGRSTALVRPDGHIDWWCAPAMDSEPVLWSLLDANGSAARWLGVEAASWSDDPAPTVAESVLRHRGQQFSCRDALVRSEPGVALVRLVRSAEGPLELEHELSIGGFVGKPAHWTTEAGGASRARVTDGVDVVVHGGQSCADGTVLRTTVRAATGQWAALVIAVNTELEADSGRLANCLDDLETGVVQRQARVHLPRHHPERATDALAVLEACTFAPTGAIIAAPTTSLPEAPGHDRQFDYRYSWIRDASLAVSVAALLGRRESAQQYLHFLCRVANAGVPLKGPVGPGPVPMRPVTDIRGEAVPEEREIAGIAGWAGSQPVRLGNAAAEQVQLDALGMMVEGISVYLQTGGSLNAETWQLVQSAADQAATPGDTLTNGIWEFRDAQPVVSDDIGRWLALDRAIWIARGWRPTARRANWKLARQRVRERILSAISPDGFLPQTYGGTVADASGLMVVIFGLLGPSNPLADRLVTSTLAHLGSGPFLYRYPPGGDDGFHGREGVFIPVCWWAVAALAAVGRVDEARCRADKLCAQLPRAMSEEVDPMSGESLGNTPLVWSHAEAARAMYLLDAATLKDRFGGGVLWAWRIARYIRLRNQ